MTARRDEEEQPKAPRSRQAAAYQGAFEAVFAILIAAFAGNLADDHFGTAPRYLLVGFAIGFASFVLRLVRLGRHLHETADDAETDERPSGDDD
jgi:F0F1-type ATP synthase assembly protein I